MNKRMSVAMAARSLRRSQPSSTNFIRKADSGASVFPKSLRE